MIGAAVKTVEGGSPASSPRPASGTARAREPRRPSDPAPGAGAPAEALVGAPFGAPAEAPIDAPVGAPAEAPIDAPVGAPAEAPVDAPVGAPAEAPIDAPVGAPTEAPVDAPVGAPAEAPVGVPAEAPIDAPVGVPAEAPVDAFVGAPAEALAAVPAGASHAQRHDTPLGRYVRILESVAAARTGLTLTEIAQALGLQAGTVHRLLRGLTDLGLLRPRAGSKRYVPGPRLRHLLHLTMDTAEYSELARSALDRLVEEFGETAHLARLNGDCAESVLMKQPSGADRAFVQPGRRLPLYAAASGKAILAFQDEDFIARYLARPRVRYTERTRVEEAEIRREMARIREDGMAVCENELDAGVLSYGHPVRTGDGHVLHAVGITGLADRFHPVARSRIRQRLFEAAAELGRNLGFGA